MLLTRVKAYSERKFDSNFFDLVLFNYPQEAYQGEAAKEAYSVRRAQVLLQAPHRSTCRGFLSYSNWAKRWVSLSSPEECSHLDNRRLDGFIDRFLPALSCVDVDREKCRYCHRFAERAVSIDPEYRERARDVPRSVPGHARGSF